MTRLAKTSEFDNSQCQHECVANRTSLTAEKVCQTKGQCNLEKIMYVIEKNYSIISFHRCRAGKEVNK